MVILGRRTVGCLLLLTLVWLPLNRCSYCSQPKSSRPDMVFLLIGQSNMAGRAPLANTDKNPLPGILLLSDQGRWISATNPLNRFATDRKNLPMQRIGPGDGFARRLHQAFPGKQIGLIVNARGGSSIEQWAKGQPLYDNTLKRLQKLNNLKLAGVIWHQGESNRNDPRYFEKLDSLIKNLRTDLNSAKLPFIAGQIYGTGKVNNQIRDLPDRVQRTGYASNEGLRVFDKVHFDRQSQQILGARYAEAYLAIVSQKSR